MISGRTIVTAVAIAGWFLASLAAFVIVTLVDFLGVGLIGVLIAFVATQFELESGGIAGGAYGSSMIHHQMEADRKMSPEQRAASGMSWPLLPSRHGSSVISELPWRS